MNYNIKFLTLLIFFMIAFSTSSCTDKEAERRKAIAAEYTEKMTKKFMNSFSKVSGEQPSTHIISNKYNKSTHTVKVKFKSKWLGNPGYNPIADKEIHEITGILIVYENGEIDYEHTSKNEVLQRNENNSTILNAIILTLEIVNIFSE